MQEAIKFKKRAPVTVEAIKWTGNNPIAIRDFVGMHRASTGEEHPIFIAHANQANLYIASLNRWVPIVIGEWIVKEHNGFTVEGSRFEHEYDKESGD